ncbi:MAG: LysM domain-containing protein, partial [Nitrospinota bacterium]
LSIKEDFFSNYRVEAEEVFVVSAGETVWEICVENRVPFWLLKRLNPDKDFQNLRAGESLSLPLLAKVEK